MGAKRKDKKRRNLKHGESQRNDGRYSYRYKLPGEERYHYIYAKTLEELRKREEQIKADRKREIVERYGILIANIVCLFCFLVVGILIGRWIYKGVWDGWGLHILYDTVMEIQPKHPYGAVVLGLGGFGLIGAGIYGSFRLMYTASTWFDQRPKIFKRIFPKK